MNRLQRLVASTLISLSTLVTNLAVASVATYTNKTDWQTAVGPAAQVIDFATKDDGTPLTDSQTFYSSLTLKGVTFENVYAYANLYLFVFLPSSHVRIMFPANTTTFAMDLLTGDPSLGGNYVVTLSTGEVVSKPATSNSGEFFGIVSSTSIAWADIALSTADMALDNFYIPSDTTPPTVTMVAPTQNARYQIQQRVQANYSCTDPSTVTLCHGTQPVGAVIDTTRVGAYTFFVTATDGKGNTGSTLINYAVEARPAAVPPPKRNR